ncbi:hypothetical protein Tco_1300197 [Tanacetum coccineum]
MRIIDQSGSAPIVFFNTMINKLSGSTAWELMERHGMDVDEYCPEELLNLVGKRFLFKIYFSDYNVNNHHHTYRCDAVNDDPEMIKHFKEGFIEDESQPCAPNAYSIHWNGSVWIRLASGLNCVLQMTTPSPGIEASGSGSGSGSKRAFIDLDDIESEEDEGEGGTSSQTQRLVRVKVEKEDP